MIPKRAIKSFTIQSVQGSERIDKVDQMVIEEPLEIRLFYFDSNQYQSDTLTITMRTPGQDFELAAGFLLAEGIITSTSDIVKMSYCVKGLEQTQEYNILQVKLAPTVKVKWSEIKRNFMSSSSCGVCGKTSLESLAIQCSPLPNSLKIRLQTLYKISEIFSLSQDIFNKTGGVHGAAIYTAEGQLIDLQEDIGRHNAVDKVIGSQIMAKAALPLSNRMLMVSGRTSYEILQKSLMAGIPWVVGIGPPSSLAVELAQQFNMTLIGFLKPDSLNVYSGDWKAI